MSQYGGKGGGIKMCFGRGVGGESPIQKSLNCESLTNKIQNFTES